MGEVLGAQGGINMVDFFGVEVWRHCGRIQG